MRHTISPARHLLGVLRAHSNFGSGAVWYGRAIGYRKIARWFAEMGERVPERTLRGWMARLRKDGFVTVRRARFNQGMFVTITAAVRQMGLFNAVEKPVEKLRNSQGNERPSLAAPCGQDWPQKVLMHYKHQTKKIGAARPTPPQAAPPRPTGAGERRCAAERTRKLDEFYGLKRTLAKMAFAHPRYGELSGKMRALEDELAVWTRPVPLENSA